MKIAYTIPQNPHIDGVYSYYTGLYSSLQFKNGVYLEKKELDSYMGFAKFKVIPKVEPETTPIFFKECTYLPDLIHNPTSYYYLVRKQPIPVVLTIMDAIQFLHPDMLSWKSSLYHTLIGPAAVKKADHIITISEYSKKDLIKAGIPEEKLTMIYPGVNPIFFEKPIYNQYYLEQALGIKFPYVLYVGGFNPRKNVERLIITFMGAKEKYKFNYKLVLAGGYGWSNSLVYDLAKKFHKDVIIVKDPKVEEIHALYSYASLFVYPSLYEGFGLPIAEAMACGCPVLCSDRTSMPEVVGFKEYTFNPMQIPYEMFEHIGQYPVLKEHARQRFQWKDAAEKTIEVYKKVIE